MSPFPALSRSGTRVIHRTDDFDDLIYEFVQPGVALAAAHQAANFIELSVEFGVLAAIGERHAEYAVPQP